MSFLERIAECNRYDRSHFVPFNVAGQQLGWVRRTFLPELAPLPEVFVVTEASVTLHPRLTTFAERSAALVPVMEAFAARGIVRGWRNELYPATESFRTQPLFQMERAAVGHFGLRTFGVHVNGYVRTPSGIQLWVPRRSRSKPTYPGMLDNTVAGGQPIGAALVPNVIKECREEANIPEALARRAQAVGVITYCSEVSEGLNPDAQFCFDLELPADFVPRNTDGEVDEFYLWPIEQVRDLVRDTHEFKPNCNLVIIHFLMRHGLLPPDDPDYVTIAQGLVSPMSMS